MTPTLHLFQRSPEHELYCAVPETRAVPSFLVGEGWRYAGRAERDELVSRGVPEPKAVEALDRLGFYIFYAVQRIVRSGSQADRERVS